MTGRVGFIGLGNMGAPMAGRLLEAGHSLVVYDVRPEVAAAWQARGCESVGSPSEVGAVADIVFLSLPTPDIVESVALSVASGKNVKHIVDLSTTGPVVAQKIGRELAGRGVALIDAPVSGGVAGARAGTLAVMIACSAADFQTAQPLLKNIGKLFHVGPEPGMGQTMKLLNNLLSAAALALSSEAAVMGVKAGLDADTMIDVFNAGSGRNSATQDKFPRAILPRTFNAGFTNRLMHKDVKLCMEQARAMGLNLTAAEAVLKVWTDVVTQLDPEADFTTVIQLNEKAAGVEVRGKAAPSKG